MHSKLFWDLGLWGTDGVLLSQSLGLVSKVFPAEELVNEAIKTAEKISSLSKIAVQIAKEAVNTGMLVTIGLFIREK